MFNYSDTSQAIGAAALQGLRGRAGFGDSTRNKQRKVVIANQKKVAAADCVSVPRLLERQQQQQQNKINDDSTEITSNTRNLLPLLASEPKAELTSSEEREARINKAKLDLTYRLNSIRIRKAESLEGQWRKRHEVVLGYLSFQLRFPMVSESERSVVTAAVFQRGSWVARRLREWTKSWIVTRFIPKGEQGISRRMSSWYEDEKLELYMRKYIAETGTTMTARKLATAVGTYLMSEEHCQAVLDDLEAATIEEGEEDGSRPKLYKRNGIRARSARRWLRRMGYRYRNIRKGIFLDGHEREDVTIYRQEFIQILTQLQPLIVEYDNNGIMIEKSPMRGERLRVLMAHDESTFSANNARRQAWHNVQETHLQPKSRGRGIMLSDVLFANGRVCVPDNISAEEMIAHGLDPDRRFATEFFEYGKNNSGYWTGEHLVDHIIKIVIPMFELSYSKEKYQGLFLFDNAAGHASFAADALRAQNMNLESGGKASNMRAGYFFHNAISVIQDMNFPIDHSTLPGRPKGLRIVLEERGLWTAGMRLDCANKACMACKEIIKQRQKLTKTLVCLKDETLCGPRKRCEHCIHQINVIPLVKKCLSCKTLRQHSNDATRSGCCARRIMSLQPDFLAQKGQLQEEIERSGHQVLFFPKFHCELNWIEYYWGRAKKYARDNCGYSIEALRETVPKAVHSVNSTLIGKYFRKSMRILQAYKDGITYGTQEFVKTVYKSHRRVRDGGD